MEHPALGAVAQIGLLGPVEVTVAGEPRDASTPMQRCLLAALALDAGRVVTVDTLVDRLWGQAPPAGARRTLHTYVWAARQALSGAGDPIARTAGGYVLRLEAEQIDVFRSRRLLSATGQNRAATLQAAVDLWRGEPLTGVPGDWAARVRETLAQEHVDVVTQWADAMSASGMSHQLIAPLSRLAERYPLADPIAGALIRALSDAGRSTEALAQFERHRRHLAEELGADPGAARRHLTDALGIYATLESPDADRVRRLLR
ncbi:BTAD domain-containing putative transcriptional regulator [Dactylosporangium sp. NPDC049742]|uniref:AfsR/SARP family transcriptional regulator n=1 Tax=Dactylosporangium sp. NPDC049742 TaxID=3154737 RepID=UPI00344308E8